jgi:hypothetical protein
LQVVVFCFYKQEGAWMQGKFCVHLNTFFM